MDIKMIVTDLDDTLLRSDKTISKYTKSVLARCRRAGIKTAYATARGGSAKRLVPLELFDGLVMMGGAVAYINDTAVYNRLIPFEVARPLLLACHARGLKTTSEISGMHYTNYPTPDQGPMGGTTYQIVDFATHDLDAENIWILPSDTDADIAFVEARLPDGLHLKYIRDGMIMIMHEEATKAQATAELARIWGIDPAAIVAFGDDLGDIGLLRFAGIGVAMDNALPEVKAAAREICKNNNDDGVAHWLEKVCFEKSIDA